MPVYVIVFSVPEFDLHFFATCFCELVHSSSCFAQLWKSFFHEIWPFDDNSPFHDGGPGAGSGGDIRTGVGGSSGGAAERTMA